MVRTHQKMNGVLRRAISPSGGFERYELESDDKPIQGLPETGKPSQPKVEPHNTRDEDDHRIGG